jgi:hypothetical protein
VGQISVKTPGQFSTKINTEDRPQELREAYEDALSRGPKWRDRLAASLARMPETAQALAG